MIYESIIVATIIVGIPLAGLVLVLRRARDWRDVKVPYQVVEVRVPLRWYRAAQHPIVYWEVVALTGVSVTFSPLFLFMLGRWGMSGFDWRVVACFLITYLVPTVYLRLGAPVLQHAWDNRGDAQSLSSDPV